MSGNVYVFNTTNQTLQLVLNDTVVSSQLAGVTQSGGYAPTTTTIARNPSSGNPETNQFGGQNSLVVSYDPGGGGTSQTFTINIPTATYPISSDLQLYIFYGSVVLEYNNTGSTISGTQSAAAVVSGRTLSPKEAAQLKNAK